LSEDFNIKDKVSNITADRSPNVKKELRMLDSNTSTASDMRLTLSSKKPSRNLIAVLI
jgi:hypothetical protein